MARLTGFVHGLYAGPRCAVRMVPVLLYRCPRDWTPARAEKCLCHAGMFHFHGADIRCGRPVGDPPRARDHLKPMEVRPRSIERSFAPSPSRPDFVQAEKKLKEYK